MTWKRPACVAAYLILFILAAAGAYELNDRFGYTPLLFLALLPPADLFCALRERRCFSLRCSERYRETARGCEASFPLAVENRSSLLVCRVRLVCRIDGPQGFRAQSSFDFCLAPQSERELKLLFTPKHTGFFRLTVRSIRIYGPVGLFCRKIMFREPLEILAVPGAKRPEVLPVISSFQTGAGSGNIGRGSGDYDGVRGYLPGDSLHRIHWKMTAHRGEMMTRVFLSEEEPFATVAADLRLFPGPREQAACVRDCLCETVCGAAAFCLSQNQSVRLVFCDGAEALESLIRSESDLNRAAFLLAAAKPAEGLPDVPSGRGTVLAVSAQPCGLFSSLLRAAASAGADVTLYYVLPAQGKTSDPLPELKALESAGVKYTALLVEAPLREHGSIRAEFSAEEAGVTA